MRQETFTLSQKELQRVTVISRCVQGNAWSARRDRPSDKERRRCRSARLQVKNYKWSFWRIPKKTL